MNIFDEIRRDMERISRRSFMWGWLSGFAMGVGVMVIVVAVMGMMGVIG